MRPRRAFTLIELLIVISIIAILASILLVTINMVREATKRTKTEAILRAVVVGVSSSAMRTQMTISPVPHPLANTAPTRSVFVRGDAVATRYAVGDVVASAGEALMTSDPKTVAATEIARVLMPADRYCGTGSPSTTDAPMLFGLPRQYMTVFGSALGLVTVRRLPAPSSTYDRNGDGVLDSPPYTNNPGAGSVAYPDSQFLYSVPGLLSDPTQLEIDAKKLMDNALGPEVLSELSSLGGIRLADSTTGAPIGSTLISNNRLRSWAEGCAATFTAFDMQAEHTRSLVLDTDGKWKPYRLRGPAIYDAWNHEVLFYTSSNGSLALESAGKDGFFRWHPGNDLTFQTAASSDVAAGDDRPADKDNILTGQR